MYDTNTPICRSSLSTRELLRWRLARVREGVDRPLEFLLLIFKKSIELFTGVKLNFAIRFAANRIFRDLKMKGMKRNGDDFYQLGDFKFPLLSTTNPAIWDDFLHSIFMDDYFCYLYLDDCYEEQVMDKYYYLLMDGPYCLKNDRVDVRVEPGDVVFDVGSWIGDFSVYAAGARKAVVYAFEPLESNYRILQRTAELNEGIIPVFQALGDSCGRASIEAHSSASRIVDSNFSGGGGTSQSIPISTLDTFVWERGLERVDFIKADIEGYERNLLMGAQETLKRFAPKLALCTYHLPDDPEVLAGLIRQANPEYKIVQKRMKLFASV